MGAAESIQDWTRLEAIETADILRIENPLPFPDWMEAYFVLTEESSATGSAGNWKNRPEQRGLCHAMANLEIPVYIEMAPAQVGKSKRLTGFYGYTVRELRRNISMYQPTDPLAKTFSVTQIDSMLASCPRVAEALMVEHTERHKFNSNKFKQFAGASAYSRGANTDNNLRQITVDTVVVDDWDGCPRTVRSAGNKNMGTVRARAMGRTQASVLPKGLFVTTPGEKGDSLVEEAVEACDVVMVYEVPCHCGHHQELILNTSNRETSHGLIYDTMQSDAESAMTARYCCASCGQDFTWSEMRKQKRKGGRWRCRKTGIIQFDLPGDPRDGHYYDPAVCSETQITDPVEIAYCHSSLISDDKPWSQIIAQWLSALRLLAAGDTSALVQFFNEILGKVSEPPEAETFTNDELCTRLETYDAECPYGVQMIMFIVDVQKRYFDYEYVGVGYGLETWGLGTGEIYGQTYDRTHKCWTELAELEKRVFVNQRGEPIPVSCTFIDAQNRPDDVLSWCEKRPRYRWGVRGQKRHDHPICMIKPPSRSKGSGGHRCYQVNMGAQKCSEKMYAMLGIEKPEEWVSGDLIPGLMHFPDVPGYREIDTDSGEVTSRYFDQLIAEQLVEVVRGGKVLQVYDCPAGVRNEKHDLRKIVLAGVEARIRRGFRFKHPDLLPPYVEPDNIGEAVAKPKSDKSSKANAFAAMAKGFSR